MGDHQIVRRSLDPGVTWWGWHVSTPLELTIVAAMGAVMLTAGIVQFQHVD